MNTTQGSRIGLLAITAALAAAVAWVMPPVSQDPAYHQFADCRTILRIPHFWNVISNLPFAVAGCLGIWVWPRASWRPSADRWAWLVVVAATFGIGIGSAYYHWAPDNTSLYWDRLPMTIAFMGLFAAAIADYIHPRLGSALLLPLLLLGIWSVESWRRGELAGGGDLRLYALVQFYPLAAIPLMVLFFPSRYTHSGSYWAVLGWYALAKVFEMADAALCRAVGFGGHALKHLAAAVALAAAFRMVAVREERP